MKMNKLNYNAPQVTVITLGVEKGICQANGYSVNGFGFENYNEDSENYD